MTSIDIEGLYQECFPEAKREPKDEGYYWAKLFSHSSRPCIVFVNKQFVVSVCGDRSRYSFHYDVVEWCSGKIEFKEK